MSWTLLKPLPNSTGRPMSSAQVRVNKDGAAKLHLFLSQSLYSDFGEPTKVSVMTGSDETAGQIRLEPDPTGLFEFKRFLHGGGRLAIPVCASAPEIPTNAHPCKIIAAAPTELILALPIEDFAAEIAERTRTPKPPPPPAAPPSPPIRATAPTAPRVDARISAEEAGLDGKRVHAASYLRSKGLKVDVLAEGRLQINGEVQDRAKVVQRVNALRAKADLPAVLAIDVII